MKVRMHSKLDPHNQNGIHCHFLFGGRAVVSPHTIPTEKKIDMISRQQGCDKAISCNNPINAAEKRDSAPRICPVYEKLIESE